MMVLNGNLINSGNPTPFCQRRIVIYELAGKRRCIINHMFIHRNSSNRVCNCTLVNTIMRTRHQLIQRRHATRCGVLGKENWPFNESTALRLFSANCRVLLSTNPHEPHKISDFTAAMKSGT